MTAWLLLGGLTVGASALGTGVVRRYALHKALVDLPNRRGSHTVPTPRGGGAAMVAASLLAWALAALWIDGVVGPFPGVVIAAVGVAALGFADDHGHVPAPVRLAAHAALAGLAVWSLGDLMPPLAGPWGLAVAVMMVVSYINVTNFMDGIDGIAAVEAISVCAGAIALMWLAGARPGEVAGAVLIGSATVGFLLWNWPPARIFMGDVGSGFLGFMFAVLILDYGRGRPAVGYGLFVLTGVFVVDAAVTLVIRVARRESIFEAHRSHAYQMLTARWRAHRPVTLICLAVNLVWLWPIAMLIVRGTLGPMLGLLVGWAPIAVAVAWVNWSASAGERVS